MFNITIVIFLVCKVLYLVDTKDPVEEDKGYEEEDRRIYTFIVGF